MPPRLFAIDRVRPAEAAGYACCALLAALVLWLFVRLVWSLLPRGDMALESPTRMRVSAAPAPATQSIARWHLFGDTPQRPGAGPGAPATTLSLILRGTFAGNDPRSGMAVIADAGNGERAYRAGDEVQPGVRLGEVHADHVVLLRDGASETLTLPRDSQLRPTDVVRPTPARVTGGAMPLPRAGAGAAPTGATHNVKAPADWQQTVSRLRQNPDELMQRVQVVPVLDNGKLAGVRLSAGADSALLSQLGLLPGDVVTSVNGLPVDSLARGQQIMASLGSAQSVRVIVQRNGKPTELTVALP